MKGYQAIVDALNAGHVLQTAFIYVDAMPITRFKAKLPLGVCVVNSQHDIEGMQTGVFEGAQVHVEGSDPMKVVEIANHVFKARPRRIILNWHDAMEIWE